MENRKIWIIAVAVIAVALIAGGLLWLDNQSRRRNTAEAPVEILDVRSHWEHRRSHGSSHREHRIHYRYRLNGQWIEDRARERIDRGWAVGRPAKVCYDPSNPRRHRLEEASYRCGT